MPKVRFTNAWLQSVKSDPAKGVWYSEAGGKGLRLYVGASGKKTWYMNYRRPGEEKKSQHKIGDADYFSVSMARDAAIEFLAAVNRGESPWLKNNVGSSPLNGIEPMVLENFIKNFYEPWVIEHRRAGRGVLAMISCAFVDFMKLPIPEITPSKLEQWRSKYRHENNTKAVTVNRYVSVLKAAINWGVKRGIIEANPITQFERLDEDDSDTKIRYFSPEERERFYAALDAREEQIRQERENHNAWLAEREEPLFPDLRKCAFADYLKPMVIVSLNTGMRRGSLFKLLWSDINFQEGGLTIRAAIAKGKKDIHIPMNPTLTKTLLAWKEQTERDGDELVFPSPKTGGVMDNCRNAWASLLKTANIKNFRWHDMRHDFASQLVMKGVDLNTVRELMGHSDLKMTLRYAHLAPQVKRAAVEMLG